MSRKIFNRKNILTVKIFLMQKFPKKNDFNYKKELFYENY